MKEFKIALLVFVIWRVLITIVMAIAPLLLPYRPSFANPEQISSFSYPHWIAASANFDGLHYLNIAKEGYEKIKLSQAFFPLYPVLIKLLSSLGFSLFFSGMFISNIALILFLMLILRLFSRYTILALLLFPTSFFLTFIYTESLFLLLVIATLYATNKEKWFWAVTLAMLASATRIVGVFLVPLILIEMWRMNKNWKHLLFACFGSLGLLSYMLYLQLQFHDALLFAHVQSAFGAGRDTKFTLYPQVVFRYLKILISARPIDWKYFTYVQELLTGIIGLITLALSSRKANVSLVFFSLLAFLFPPLSGNFSSMGRYTLVCLPIFIYLGQKLERKEKLAWVWLGISTVLLFINLILFTQGYWVA